MRLINYFSKGNSKYDHGIDNEVTSNNTCKTILFKKCRIGIIIGFILDMSVEKNDTRQFKNIAS